MVEGNRCHRGPPRTPSASHLSLRANQSPPENLVPRQPGWGHLALKPLCLQVCQAGDSIRLGVGGGLRANDQLPSRELLDLGHQPHFVQSKLKFRLRESRAP